MAERTLPGLGLTGFWDLGQNEWNDGMDANIRKLSALSQLTVLSATTALPGSPTDGDIYIVPSGGNANSVAVRDNGAWTYFVPVEGWRAWVRDTNMLVIFDGAAWAEFEAGGGGGGEISYDAVGINADPDLDDRLFVKSDGVVFSHDDVTPGSGSVAVKVNKADAGDDALLSFENDWSTRALLGLLGDDNLAVTVSPDGSTYHQSVIIDRNTGNVGLGGAAPDANNVLAVKGSSILLDAESDGMVATINKTAPGEDAGFYFQDGYETRAVFGLMGDDNFSIRVSSDGINFWPTIHADIATGHVGFGTAGDPNNRLSVKGTSALFDAETDDFRFTFNKKTAADDAALTFQTNYSGRALIGLLGSDDFVFTVSPDGSTYTQAMIIDKDTAAVSLPQHPKFSAFLNYGNNYTAGAWRVLQQNNTRHNDQSAWASNVFTAPHDGYYLFGVGATFETPGTIPTKMQVGLSINSAAPTPDTVGTTGDATIVSLETHVNTTALLKLSAGDTVNAAIYFTGNDGRVLADENYFWGHQVI